MTPSLTDILADRLTIFEVDHPLSQAWKRRRLNELQLALPHNVVFAAVDFERQALDGGLIAAGVDFDRPAVDYFRGVDMGMLDVQRLATAIVPGG